jgi:aminomethyltransferase
MDVRIIEPDVSPMQIQGPKSPLVVAALFGDWAATLKYFRCRETSLGDIPVVLARTGWSGEIGYEIFLRDGSRGDDLWEAVMKAGKPHRIMPAGPSEIRSIEGGILSYGCDIIREDNPFTIGLDRLVDLEQETDFIGKQALKRIRAAGVTRRLVGVEMVGEPLRCSLEDPWPVFDGDQVTGRMTRAAYSPRLKKNLGFANVPVNRSNHGDRLKIRTPVGMVQGTVVPKPFITSSKTVT